MNRKVKATLLVAALVVLAGICAASVVVLPAAKAADKARADIIVIDELTSFGPLERPPVVFFHDKHTKAMAAEKKDCLSCHPMNGDRMSLKYQRIENTDKQKVMDIYHSQCVACHKEKRQQQKESGPITCGGCHEENVLLQSDWQSIGMDRSLHYRHSKAFENKCELCHHKYNADTKKLYYAKGEEGACIYCHKEQTEENRISIQLASHLSCVSCHRKQLAENKKAGPLECAGCHSPEQQALIEKIQDPPRLERNQPDVALVRTHGKEVAAAAPPSPPQARMPRVPFNHKAHEGYSDYCRTCHHAALTPCAACHTIEGQTDGGMVKLAQSMHQPNASMSCVGCHNDVQNRPACAGCHRSIPAERVWASETSCSVCHVPYAGIEYPQDPEAMKQLAADLLKERPENQQMVAFEDIPETVTIGHLVDQYEAVQMPHRKVMLKLAELTRDNNLATAFHTQPTTLCQGCHHYSPPSLKPPQCGSCHGKSSDVLNLRRPGLMAAYHEQCLQCHDQMGITKPANRDCTACHAKRTSLENKS